MLAILTVLTILTILTAFWASTSPGCMDKAPSDGRRAGDAETIQASIRPPDVASGRRLFTTHCALCHGERADGRGARQANFARPPRDFTSRVWRSTATFGGVADTVRHGIPGTAMPAWPALTDDEVRDLAAYLLSVAPGDR
jgi:mono/diheme cytochrome c family protein